MPINYRLFKIGLGMLALGNAAIVLKALSQFSLPIALGLCAVALWLLLNVPSRVVLAQLFFITSVTALLTLSLGEATVVIFCAAAWAGLLCFLVRTLDELPLNAMDYGLIVTTYEGRPVSTRYVLETKEPFSYESMHKAVAALVEEVPLLRSFISESLWQMKRFVAAQPWFKVDRLLAWHDCPLNCEESLKLDEQLNLQHLPPFKLSHNPRADGGYCLILTLHHAASDGAGGLMLLNRLLYLYEAMRLQREVPPAVLPTTMRFREALCTKNWPWWRNFLAVQIKLFKETPLQSADLLERPRDITWRHAVRIFDLAPQLWDQLGESAHRQGASRYQLLVSAALKAAASFRAQQGKSSGALRPLLPADMRALLGFFKGVQNFASDLPVTFSSEDVSSEHLVPTVTRSLHAAHDLPHLLSTPFYFVLLRLLLPVFLMRKFLRMADQHSQFFRHSFLLSHPRPPRDFFHPQDIAIERLWCTSTMARQPGVGWVVTGLGKRITLVLQYNEPLLSRERAYQLNELFLDELHRAAEA